MTELTSQIYESKDYERLMDRVTHLLISARLRQRSFNIMLIYRMCLRHMITNERVKK
jgi:hypothetical protein